MRHLILPCLLWSVTKAIEYGADCSWPIFDTDFSCGDRLGDRASVYHDFISKCHDYGGPKGVSYCDRTEMDRLEMNTRQPKSMVNYTSTGFTKIKAPKDVMDLILQHWEANKDNMVEESWPKGSIYLNYWESKTYMVAVEDRNLRGAGDKLKEKIWDAAKTTIEAWTNVELQPTSMYGIRVYTEGAILSPHVDRLPLVSSCIINVAQDVDEPWPLEVYDRDGNAVNVTMEPGDMVLYESASTLHGRPFPLKGRSYANIFIHFEPTGRPLNDHSNGWVEELDDFLPPYLIPGSEGAEQWSAENPGGWNKPSPAFPVQNFDQPAGHYAAATGDFYTLKELSEADPQSLHRKDPNGWLPIHEAVRAGHTDIVELLIEKGAHKDARTGTRNNGSSPLNMALEFHGEDHPLTAFLLAIGAQDIGYGEL